MAILGKTATSRLGRPDLRERLVEASSLTPEQLPMLRVIFDRVGSQLTERLRKLSSSLPHFTLNAIETARIGATLDAHELNAVAGVFHVPAWENRVICGFDRDFIYTMIETLYGGDGSERPLEDLRAFTNIELQVCRFLFGEVGHALQSGFGLVTNARFAFERVETRMDFAGAGKRNGPAIVVRFILQALNRGGEMFVVIPQAALTPLRHFLSRIATREEKAPDPAWVGRIKDEVERTEVRVRAVVESKEFTLGDIAKLRVGQVLKLPVTPQSRIKVESNSQPLFWAFLGQSDGRHTLCIDEAIDQEREFINDVLAR
ncbi:FliM/FliN family flagellar motor switch protein [Enterovirga sp.]|uniref:flagellar motor switch protein FliM n=1 Tax=Enterovirga sp. TaxID=2026350 RepID=UPI002B98CF48|nr:FliM/FliN family flagellar motor switch protein [Enterovirga sp.]HMO30762.1 FliM/FliN family flagellar motor switch protein [Enterovirga sp.]